MTDEDPRTADLCATLAVLAYRAGDGALGQVAADRALRINPAHRLAHLAVQIMASAIRPEDLDTSPNLAGDRAEVIRPNTPIGCT